MIRTALIATVDCAKKFSLPLFDSEFENTTGDSDLHAYSRRMTGHAAEKVSMLGVVVVEGHSCGIFFKRSALDDQKHYTMPRLAGEVVKVGSTRCGFLVLHCRKKVYFGRCIKPFVIEVVPVVSNGHAPDVDA